MTDNQKRIVSKVTEINTKIEFMYILYMQDCFNNKEIESRLDKVIELLDSFE